jgi:hypothetical protein
MSCKYSLRRSGLVAFKPMRLHAWQVGYEGGANGGGRFLYAVDSSDSPLLTLLFIILSSIIIKMKLSKSISFVFVVLCAMAGTVMASTKLPGEGCNPLCYDCASVSELASPGNHSSITPRISKPFSDSI